MSRVRSVLLSVLAFMFILAIGCTASSETPRRELTVMVYMCGSNLESALGSASADLEEMVSAHVNPAKTGLLVMAGGSDTDVGDFSSGNTRILEIAGSRKRCIDETASLNMGSPETLTRFIRYCVENRPAEKYALILWDHGGGPLEGVCWDEINGMDHLSLSELTKALSAAKLDNKLSWIGFDACLMSSMEIAVHLAPYADYMIASQETEPSFGWNYSFLSGLESDSDASETGRRIVDAYFEGHEQSRENLTLACIDLEKAAEASAALGDYFSEVEKTLNTDTFSLLSNLRMNSIEFGDSIRGIEEDNGYDLVDAIDLVSHMDRNPGKKERVISLLESAVIYNRSNAQGAAGLTLYHPYHNPSKFLSEWRNRYRSTSPIKGYARYIQSFGTILTGDQLVRWTHLKTLGEPMTSDGVHSFSVQLTPEQASHFSSGQLLIVRDTTGSNVLDEGVAVVSVNHASLDENGMLTASYNENALYVEQEDGQLFGPLNYLQTANGAYNIVIASYIPVNEYGLDNAQSVLFYLDAKDESEHPEIIRVRVWDDATQSYSSRLGFSESLYRMVSFWNRNRSYPNEEDGILPDYNSWENGSVISMFDLPLPDSWRFTRLQKQNTGSQLYAMFQITDTQQNTCCTVPVPVTNTNLREFAGMPEKAENLGYTLSLSGQVNHSDLRSLHLMLTVENTTDQDGVFSIENIRFNDQREIDEDIHSHKIAGHETQILEWDIAPEYLALIDKLETISFQLTDETGTRQQNTADIQFALENCDIQSIQNGLVLGSAAENGISLDVLNIQPANSGGFEVTALIGNNSETELYINALALNDIQSGSGADGTVGPGKSKVIVFQWDNGLTLDNTAVEIPGSTHLYYQTMLVRQALLLHGYDKVQTVSLVFSDAEGIYGNWKKVTAVMDEPWTVQEEENIGSQLTMIPIYSPFEAAESTPLVPVAENDRYTVMFRRMILGREQVVLVFEIMNQTDDVISIMADNIYLNNGSIGPASTLGTLTGGIRVAPKCTLITPIIVGRKDGVTEGLEITDISLQLYEKHDKIDSAGTILLNAAVSAGKTGLTWISADQAEIKPVRLKMVDTKEAIALSGDILPEGDLSAHLQWIDAPLSDEEILNMEDGQMLLVLPFEDKGLTVITYQAMIRNDEGKVGAWFPGLIACSAADREDMLTTILRKVDKNQLEASVFSRLSINNDDYMDPKFIRIHSIRFTVDYEQNTAVITDSKQDGDTMDRQSDMVFISWPAYIVYPGTETDGNLVSFDDMEVETKLFIGWEEDMHDQPFRIMLRSITPEDDAKILFSVTNKDGTGYSRMRSYPVQ